jgi:hypothetical protein
LDKLDSLFSSRPPYFRRGGWVNGNNYMCSIETFGIMPIPEITHQYLGMVPFDPKHVETQKIRHAYLAQAQGTLCAILPIHTHEERVLFRDLASLDTGPLAGPKQPDWYVVTQMWSSYCNGINVFYKVSKICCNTVLLLIFYTVCRTVQGILENMV